MPTATRDSLISNLRLLKRGVLAHLRTTSLVVRGVTYSGPQLVALIDDAIAASLAVGAAQGALTNAVVNEAAVQKQVAPTLQGLRDMVRVMFHDNHTTLGAFGLEPRKERTPLTSEKLLLRAERVRATRKARNTRGSRQKKAIKGDVIGVTITPIATPALPEGGAEDDGQT
jgi:hypothetical protein